MEQHNLQFIAPNGIPSECLVDLYPKTGLVVVTDIDRGISRSAGAVTNACEAIANEIVGRDWVDAQKMIYIERYRQGQGDKTTDLVRFDFADGKAFRCPRWKHLDAQDFARKIAMAE